MKISLQRISTKDLATLAQRVIHISKKWKTPSATALRRELKKTLRAYLDFVNYESSEILGRGLSRD